jgi:hypothetical protein
MEPKSKIQEKQKTIMTKRSKDKFDLIEKIRLFHIERFRHMLVYFF